MECNHFDFVRFLLLVSFHFQVMERKRSHLPKKWRFILHNREALEGPFSQRWMTQNKIIGKMNCLLEAMPFEHPEESSVFFLYSFVFYPGHIFSSLSKYCIMHESITTIFKETARYDWNFILLYTITCFFYPPSSHRGGINITSLQSVSTTQHVFIRSRILVRKSWWPVTWLTFLYICQYS